MDFRKLKTSKYSFFILAVLFLLGFSLLYFLYYRQRNQAEVYVGLSLIRNPIISVSAIYNWIPNWLDDSIVEGDREVSPLGGLTATVLAKESYEAPYFGRYTYLLLKMNAVKDRSGTYLFKNKPLSVGGLIDLKLTKTQISGLVTYVGNEAPTYQYKKLLVKIRNRNFDSWAAEVVKVGSVIVNNKGEEIAKVIDKKINPASGAQLNLNPNNRDLEVTVKVLVKKTGENYFYGETQKVKVDEELFLPFKEVSLNLQITSVTEVSETR